MSLPEPLRSAIALLAAATIAACAATPEAPTQVQISDEVAAKVNVLAVNKATRELTLERTDGSPVVVVAGPEVRNFDQIRVGDKVTARYVVTLSARLLAPDEPNTKTSIGALAARAQPGQRPAGAIGADVAMTVVIKSVDVDKHLVIFTGPDGALDVVEAEREEGQRFIAGLKPGDRVEVIYGKLFVLAVE